VVKLETTLQGFIVLRLWVYLPECVVARDDDCPGAELNTTSFGLGREGIVICPLLEMMSADLLGA